MTDPNAAEVLDKSDTDWWRLEEGCPPMGEHLLASLLAHGNGSDGPALVIYGDGTLRPYPTLSENEAASLRTVIECAESLGPEDDAVIALASAAFDRLTGEAR